MRTGQQCLALSLEVGASRTNSLVRSQTPDMERRDMHNKEAQPSQFPSVPRWEPGALMYFKETVNMYFRRTSNQQYAHISMHVAQKPRRTTKIQDLCP